MPSTFFPKICKFPKLSVIFVCFLINEAMKKFLYMALAACVFLSFFSMPAHAQKERAEARHENMVLSAVARYNERDIDSAVLILKEVVADDPQNDGAWYYLGQCAIAKNDPETAEQCYRMASEIDPSNFWYRYRLARLYAVTSRAELTVDMYEKLLEDFPKKSDLYFDLVELYGTQQEYEKALETLKEIETVFGMTESIAVYRFNLLRMLNRQEEAFQSLQDYNKEYSSPFILATLADYEMAMYNDSTALAYYDEALELAPDYSPALLGKAEALRMTRRYEEYFNVLDKYIVTEDTPAGAKGDYLMAVVQRTDPKFVSTFQPQLDTVMDKVLKVHPKDSILLHAAAVYYYSTDRMDQAKKHFKANLEAWPESFAAAATHTGGRLRNDTSPRQYGAGTRFYRCIARHHSTRGRYALCIGSSRRRIIH